MPPSRSASASKVSSRKTCHGSSRCSAGLSTGLAGLLSYGPEPYRRRTIEVKARQERRQVGISLIGFGNHVLAQHRPNLKSIRDVELRGIASATGRNCLGRRRERPRVDGHDRCGQAPQGPGHRRSARLLHSARALRTRPRARRCWVEKPMVTRLDDFAKLLKFIQDRDTFFTVGLNRSLLADRAGAARRDRGRHRFR